MMQVSITVAESSFYEKEFCDTGFCDSDDAFMQAALDVASRGRRGGTPVDCGGVRQAPSAKATINRFLSLGDATGPRRNRGNK